MIEENPDSSASLPKCGEILLVEDDPEFRAAAVRLLVDAQTAHLVTAVGTGAEAINLVRQRSFDILLVDLHLPDMGGIDVIQGVRALGSQAEIMVITTSQNPKKIIGSIQAGACGYFLKNNLDTHMLPYLNSLRRGGSPLDPIIARRLLEMLHVKVAPAQSKPPSAQRVLSDQETNILTYVAKGLTSKEIAEMLRLSVLTVNTHIRNIYRKLQVKNRTEAVFEASSQGLIPPVILRDGKPTD